MTNNAPLEIERKYLIDRPSEEMFRAFSGVRYRDILQTYLLSEQGEARRVRESRYENGEIVWQETVKRRVNDMTAEEYERDLTKEEYERLLLLRDGELRTIEKRRYEIPYKGHVLEIDVYPFWKRTAVLEIELSHEDEEIHLPEFLSVLREVSAEKAYKNRALARRVPSESEARGEATE